MPSRQPYPSDVSDEEWALVAPYLTRLSEDVGQREHSLREVFNGLRYVVKTGAPWRWMPHDLPPWAAVYQQAQRWLVAGCFEADLRMVLRLAAGHKAQPSAAILDSRTRRSSPESGTRAGYDGAKRKKGSKRHLAVDTLGHLLPAIGERLCALRQHPCRPPPRRLRLPHAQAGRSTHPRSVTASRPSSWGKVRSVWARETSPQAKLAASR